MMSNSVASFLWGIRLLERKAERRAAIDRLETAVRLGPADTQAHRWLAKAYQRAGQPEKALAPAQQALSLSPNSPLVKLEMGGGMLRGR